GVLERRARWPPRRFGNHNRHPHHDWSSPSRSRSWPPTEPTSPLFASWLPPPSESTIEDRRSRIEKNSSQSSIFDPPSSIFYLQSFPVSENSLLPTRCPRYTRQEVEVNFHQNRKSLPMRWSRPLLLPLLVGVGILAAGAMGQQPTPPAQPAGTPKPAPPPFKPATADPAASKILEEALQAKRLDWI